MKVTVAVARVYGTKDQYGDKPRLAPPGVPIVFADFPARGASVTADFGAVPGDVIEADRRRRAIGEVAMRGIVPDPRNPQSREELIDEAFEEIDPNEMFGTYNWYATFVLTREVELDDELPADFTYGREIFKLQDDSIRYAAPALDVIATVTASVLRSSTFDHLVLDDRVLLLADGHRPSGIPVFIVGGFEASIKTDQRELQRMGEHLKVLASIKSPQLQNCKWVSSVAHWRVQGLLERDSWKRFLWTFFALEILTHRLFDQRHDDVVSRVRILDEDGVVVEERLPFNRFVAEQPDLGDQFVIVAADLFPADARDDYSKFMEAKTARNDLAHGRVRDPGTLPTQIVRTLLDKYLEGAIKKLVLDESPGDSWDDIAARS